MSTGATRTPGSTPSPPPASAPGSTPSPPPASAPGSTPSPPPASAPSPPPSPPGSQPLDGSPWAPPQAVDLSDPTRSSRPPSPQPSPSAVRPTRLPPAPSQLQVAPQSSAERVGGLEQTKPKSSPWRRLSTVAHRVKEIRKIAPQKKLSSDGSLSQHKLFVGDLLFLAVVEGGNVGMLHGHTCLHRCGLQRQGPDHEPLNAKACIFRLVPELQYKAAEELLAMKGGRHRRGSLRSQRSQLTRQRSGSISSNGDYAKQIEILERRNAQERAHNEVVLQQTVQGDKSHAAALYGRSFQLQHVQSGLFVCANQAAAAVDAAHRKVCLAAGGVGCHWRIKPRFLIRTEGSPIYSGDDWVIESVALRGHFLAASHLPYATLQPKSKKAAIEAGLGDTVRYDMLEINCCTSPTTFRARRFAHVHRKDERALFTNEIFQIYHPQGVAFVRASCDPRKELQKATHAPYLKPTKEESASGPGLAGSGKNAWSIELESRMSGGSISYNRPVRIRHILSGKYLSVDLASVPSPRNEQWFQVQLVDASDDSHETSSHMRFFLHSTEATAGADLPKPSTFAGVAIRIEHRLQPGSSLWLHDTGRLKEKEPNIELSRTLVFSTMRHTTDVFTLTPLDPSVRGNLDRVASSVAVAKLYTILLSNPEEKLPPSPQDVYDELAMLQETINLCAARDHPFDSESKDVWYKRALKSLPAEFAQLPAFNGDRDEVGQTLCREAKLMDAVWSMTMAPYHRGEGANPFSSDVKGRKEMQPIRAISKFAYVSLQRMFATNHDAQLRFAQKMTLKPGGGPNERLSWITALIERIEQPLGAAVTLSELLSTNELLLRRFVNDALLNDFARQITSVGPQPRLIQFFAKVCSVHGRAIKANQERCLRKAWLSDERPRMLIDVIFVPSSRNAKELTHNSPAAFLGKELVDAGLPYVKLAWSGCNEWTPNMRDHLFYSAESLGTARGSPPCGVAPDDASPLAGLRYEQVGLQQRVDVEQLCVHLDPQLLSERVTRMKFGEYMRQKDVDGAFAERCERCNQLGQYFLGQLRLLSKMCHGRSYNCIRILSESFGYVECLSLCANELLPASIRSAAYELVRVLYVDRYPQTHFCGRPAFPELVWIYHSDAVGLAEGVPVVCDVCLDDEDSLPSFSVGHSHPLRSHADPVLSFHGSTKFWLLRQVCTFEGSGRIALSDVQGNEMFNAMLKTTCDLMSFGFYSDLRKIVDVVPGLIRMLDGRTDVKDFVRQDTTATEGDDSSSVPDSALEDDVIEFEGEERWAIQEGTSEYSSLKCSILKILNIVCDLRANFRLSKVCVRA